MFVCLFQFFVLLLVFQAVSLNLTYWSVIPNGHEDREKIDAWLHFISNEAKPSQRKKTDSEIIVKSAAIYSLGVCNMNTRSLRLKAWIISKMLAVAR